MREIAERQIIFIFASILVLGISYSYRYEPNTLTVKNFSECPGVENNVAHINQTILPVGRNKYAVNGELTFDEYFPGHLEVFSRHNSEFRMIECVPHFLLPTGSNNFKTL